MREGDNVLREEERQQGQCGQRITRNRFMEGEETRVEESV